MKFHESNIVEQIRNAREKTGLSLKKLEKKFGVPNSTISRWVRDIENSNLAFNAARKNELLLKQQYLENKNYKINQKEARFLCSLLYWCEGSKYPSTNFVAFCNSDGKLIFSFLYLLRKGFKISEQKFKVQLQLHNTHNVDLMTNYWSKLLKIPKSQFHKPTITSPHKKRKRRNYLGTCTVKYFDVKLLLGITGIYNDFVKSIIRKGGRAV